MSSNRLQFEGDLNETALFQLEFDNSAIKFELKTSQYCPPGYYLSDRNCVCGSKIIFGIAYCNENINRAFILHGFWIGFLQKWNSNLLKSLSSRVLQLFDRQQRRSNASYRLQQSHRLCV